MQKLTLTIKSLKLAIEGAEVDTLAKFLASLQGNLQGDTLSPEREQWERQKMDEAAEKLWEKQAKAGSFRVFG